MSDPTAQPAATPAPGGRKPLTRAEAARHASLVRWGKEQPFAARLAAIRAKKKAGGKGKGKKAPKAKLTQEQKDAQRTAKETENRTAIGEMLLDADHPVLGPRGLTAMAQVMEGADPNPAATEAMLASGLAERGADGMLRLSSDGKAVLNAANRGDKQGTLEALSRLSDKQAKQSEREKTTQAKEQEKTERQAEKEKLAKEQEKKGSGGGGGGKGKGGKEDKAAERERTAAATAEKVGLEADHVEALRRAAEDGTGGIPELDELGLTKDGAATDQGRRALTALERGDVRAYRAAVQDAASRMEREKAAEWRRYNQTARQRIQAARRAHEATKALEAAPTRVLSDGHTGVMAALYPDTNVARQLAALPGVTEPIGQMHLTLCFLGDSTETSLATNKARLVSALQTWAIRNRQPIKGTINGFGRFFHSEDDDTNAVFVSPDIPGLPELRQSLAMWIEQSGFDYVQNHGFTPHITVAYIPKDAPTPDIRVGEIPVTFDRVVLAWGDEQYDL